MKNKRKLSNLSFALLLAVIFVFSSISFVKAAEESIIIQIDAPLQNAQLSGSTDITGWAIGKTQIKEVKIKIDNKDLGQATYGLENQQVYNQYPSYAGSLNSGYKFSLDTKKIINGNHVLTVIATCNDGTSISKDIQISTNNQQTPILGQSIATKSQMIKYFLDNNPQKGYYYINNFITILFQEASIEGVRADVAFSQMMKETNFLKFTGTVREEQNNFAGLGVTGPGVQGLSFTDIRTGIKAVIQHLKGYATSSPLNSTNVVDPRYKYINKGCAPIVEWLGINENPNGSGWATEVNYGYGIVNIMNAERNITFNPVITNINSITMGSNLLPGTSYSIKASGTSSNKILYEFWIKDSNGWNLMQPYSENDTYNWTPSKNGNYRIQVHVKDINSTSELEDVKFKDVTVGVVSARITSFNVPQDFQVGSKYDLTASSDDSRALYEFWIKDNNGWNLVQPYSENNTYNWTPSKHGNYRIQVHVKDINSTSELEDMKFKDVTVGVVPARITSFSVPQDLQAGSKYDLTASSNDSKALYEFWIKDNNGWNLVKPYSADNKYSWTPKNPGNYRLQVHVKGEGSSNLLDDMLYKDITVRSAAVATISSFNIPSKLEKGITQTISAAGAGSDSILYEFWIKDYDTGKWDLVQPYSTNSSYNWVPMRGGNYRLQVHVKSLYSQSELDNMSYKDVFVYYGKTVVLDAGHGGYDPGAQGNGYNEKDLNIDLVSSIKNKLLNLGVQVILTRQPSNDVYVSLDDRSKIANDNNADLFLSIHHDSSTDPKANGISTHYSTYRPGIESSDIYTSNDITYDRTPSEQAKLSRDLANNLVNSISSLGFTNKGSRDHNLAVTKNTNMVSVLVEAGFISNPIESKKVADSGMVDKIAGKIVDTIKDFFGW